MKMKANNTSNFSKEQMMEWVKGFTKWPHRMTGTPEGKESAEYVANVFRKCGLKDVKLESVDSLCTEVSKSSLKIDGKEIKAFLSNGTNRKKRLGKSLTNVKGAKLVYLEESDFASLYQQDLAGKIVISGVRFAPHIWKNTPASDFYGPNGEFDRKRKIYNVYMPENYIPNYFAAMEKGAVGFIGILKDFMDQYYYNEDYTYVIEHDGFMEIPTMWVSAEQGKELVTKVQENPNATGDLIVETISEYREAVNVMGIVEGCSEDVVVVHSHHDATGEGAVQDASGMSVVFALAQYFSKLPKEEIKTNMLFLSTDSHYTDYEGHDKFLDKRKAEGSNIVMDFCVEHIAKEVDLDANNEMIIYNRPETRILYATDEQGLADMAFDAFCRHGLTHTMLFRAAPLGDAAFDPEFVCTDAYAFHERGIPVISLLSAPMYLSHRSDTIDKVYGDGLVPAAETYAELIIRVWDKLGYGS